jgi:hypothetical protein
MTQTRPTTMVTLAIIGGVVAWALEVVLSALGQPAIVPPWSWGVGLGLLGALVLAIAWPIRQRLHLAPRRDLLDPFYATRVVLLAKSTSVAGSLFLGAAMGVGIFFLTRPVVTEDTLWASAMALLGAILLMVGGTTAERWCTLPPDSAQGSALEAPEGDIA